MHVKAGLHRRIRDFFVIPRFTVGASVIRPKQFLRTTKTVLQAGLEVCPWAFGSVACTAFSGASLRHTLALVACRADRILGKGSQMGKEGRGRRVPKWLI